LKPSKKLLEDDDVRRWYENLARGSKITAAVRLRRLNLFCEQHSTTPKGLAELGKSNIMQLENLLLDHVSNMERNKCTKNHIWVGS
jgi:hypothetical protein